MSELDPEAVRVDSEDEFVHAAVESGDSSEDGPAQSAALMPDDEEDSQHSSKPAGGELESASPDADSTDNAAADPAQLEAVWLQLRRAIRERVQPEQFETWFRRANLAGLDDQSICIAVQNGFSRDWLRNYYKDVIDDAVSCVLERPLRLSFSVDPELTLLPIPEHEDVAALVEPEAEDENVDQLLPGKSNEAPDANAPWNKPASKRKQAAKPNPREFTSDGLVRGSDIGLNPKYTFENFVVGPCNRFSHAVSLGTAEAPGKAYNPLFLHGNVGLGKTHLLQSICASLLETWHDVRILFLSCETFVNHFISALENGDLQKFRNKYRNVDVLVVDDIHVLANKERTQEEFFHTFNSLYNAGKQIVLSSDSPPKDIPTLQDRLVSRFKWGLVTEIEPPCYETRMAILKRKGRERGEELPDEVAQIIAERVDTNIRELEGAVNKLYGFANVTGQRISVDFTREVLGDLFIQRRGQPTMDDIIQIVTAHFSVKLSDLQSKKRTNQVAFPRQIAMFLARKITRHSLEEIGGFFGGRDHSTVLHGVKKITKLMESDPTTRELLAGFLDQLQGTTR